MVTIIGIVASEQMVLKDTILTESAVSALYFAANIVVFAAVGTLAEIVHAISTLPRTPQRYMTLKTKAGNTKRRNAMEIKTLTFLRASSKLLFAKW